MIKLKNTIEDLIENMKIHLKSKRHHFVLSETNLFSFPRLTQTPNSTSLPFPCCILHAQQIKQRFKSISNAKS